MSGKNNTPKEIWEEIKKSKLPVCCIDSRFDFDAVGAALAMKEVMKNELDIDLRLTWHGKFPDIARELIDCSQIEEGIDISDIDLTEHDLLIALDSGEEEHISIKDGFVIPGGITKINIDHHASNPFFGDLNLVDGNIISTCSLLHGFFEELGIEISTKMYRLLLLGILEDSGRFNYDLTSSEDFRIAAFAIDKGVDLFKIIWALTFNEPEASMRYKGLVYKNLVVDKAEKYAYSSHTINELKDLDLLGKEQSFPHGSDLIKTLKDMDFVFILKEDVRNKGMYECSFRNHDPEVDVSAFAKALGGGGHKTAASGRFKAKDTEEALSIAKATIKKIREKK